MYYPFSITSKNIRCINNISQYKQIIYKGQEVLPKNVGGDHLKRGSQTASKSLITFIMGRVFPATRRTILWLRSQVSLLLGLWASEVFSDNGKEIYVWECFIKVFSEPKNIQL